jgi:hypothetical protein
MLAGEPPARDIDLQLSVTPSRHYSTHNLTNTVDRTGPYGFNSPFNSEIAAHNGSFSSATPRDVGDDALRYYHGGASNPQPPVRDDALDIIPYSSYPQHIDPSYLSGNQLGEWGSQDQYVVGYESYSPSENTAAAIISKHGPPMTQGFPTVLSFPALLTCDWCDCNTTYPSSSMLAHWISTHLDDISDFMKPQPRGQKQVFCLWNYCHKEFKRRTDLDRHVRSIHLGINSDCTVSGCDNNGGKGYSRLDKLKAHERKAHGSM